MVSIRTYVTVWIALLILTATTTGIAFLDLGGDLNSIAALTIAVCKAVLVILYFMHLRYSTRMTWVFAAAGIFWLTLLLGGTLNDVLTRQPPPTVTNPLTAVAEP